MGHWIAVGCVLMGAGALLALLLVAGGGMARKRIYGPDPGPELRVLSPSWRPCPFCGGQPFLTLLGEEETSWHFACRSCGARGAGRPSEGNALRSWNMRA